MADKVALVTGAARGIGKGIAQCLAADGFNIVIADIMEEEQAKATVDELKTFKVEVLYCKTDISASQDRNALIRKVQEHFGRLDVLVNNAGVAPKVRADILEMQEDSWDFVMDINLKGPFFLTQLAANWMVVQKKKDAKMEPMIINISSISAYTSSPPRPQYCVSKAGVSMATALYADRLSEFDIPVYEIRPGIIQTDMTSTVKDKYDKLILEDGILPTRRWGLPEDIGKAVAALTSGAFAYSTGQVINVDGGFHLRRL